MTVSRIDHLNFFATKQNVELVFAFTARAEMSGPKIVIMGGVHGNEPVGLEAVIAIQKEIKNLKCGEITFILGNPMAYLKDVRFIESNLNRCFVKDYPQNYEGYRAKEITDFLAKYQPDFLLDLHSVSVGDIKMEIHKNENQIIRELVNDDFIQIVLSQKATSGSTIQLKFIPAGMTLECGNHKSKDGLKVALHKIRQVLQYFGMMDYNILSKKSSKEISAYKLYKPIIPYPGFEFIDTSVASESFVAKNQVYAKSEIGLITAPRDSYILMPAKNPQSTDTDAGFLAYKIVF